MRDRQRNQRTFWYAAYLHKEPVLKNGHETGQHKEIFADPIKAKAFISPPSGESEADLFGAAIQYDCIISTVQDLPGLNEYARVWVSADPATGAAHDYVVKRCAPGLNRNRWAISKVVR